MNSFAKIVLCLLIGLVLAGGLVSAQSRRYLEVPVTVLSNENIGFRIEARNGKAAVGRFVVRIDGEWVETELAPKSMFLSQTR